MDSDTLDDGVLPASARGFVQRTQRNTEPPESEDSPKSFGVVGTGPQPGIILVDGSGRPLMVPYSWLDQAYEDGARRLVIEFANELKVTLEGRGLCRPFRKSLLDILRMQRVAYVEAMPRGEFLEGTEPIVTAIFIEKKRPKKGDTNE